MKCPQIKMNRQTDILCAPILKNIITHIKKSLYIIVLTLCFVLAFIGKSYGQGWEKMFTPYVGSDGGTYYREDIRLISTTQDGGIIYARFTNNGVVKPDTIKICRDDRFGRNIWQKNLDINNLFGYGGEFESYFDPVSLGNNEFVVFYVSVGTELNNKICYYRFNANGDSITNGITNWGYMQNHSNSNMSEYITFKDSTGVVNVNYLTITDNNTNRIILNSYKYDTLYNNIAYNTPVTTDCYRTKRNVMNNVSYDRFFLDDDNNNNAYLFNYNDSFSYLYKFNRLNGNLIFSKKYSRANSLVQSGYLMNNATIAKSIIMNGKIYLFTLSDTSTANCTFQCKSLNVVTVDKNTGNILSDRHIMNIGADINNYFPLNDSLFILYGDFISMEINYKMIVNINTLDYYFPSKNKYGASYMKYDNYDYIADILRWNDDFYISFAAGNFFARTDNNGFSIPHILSGNVYSDINVNCIKNILDPDMQNLTISATKNNQSYFGTSDRNGNYEIGISDTGNFAITIRDNPLYNLWSSSFCGSTKNLFVRDTIAYDTVNFALKPNMLCPINTINVSSLPPFRIGRPQTYFVNYCNNGTTLSPNTFITIKLDTLLDFNSSTIPYTTLANHTYRFNIGNLDFITCGNFSFVATPRVGAVQLNQTLCTEAHIYPDTICTTPNYTGSYIVASAECLGDSVELKLENRGGDMIQRKRYIVIEDQVMRINHDYQLPRNGTVIEKMPADSGRTYRIIAEQEDDLPLSYGDKFATAAIEACRINPADNFSTGYFTQFPNYDGEPFRAMSCNVITGAYDPNDKVASPVGYASQHFIEKNTQIDYQINFQNTGNDTAFKVVIVDTISPTLDINSIQLGVASHAYQFQRTDSNVVQFVFDNILLVDSLRNEAKSHGFVKFKIQQKLDNANGTKIYNKADIYFDYNAPIITNQTYHTVGQNFVTVNLITAIKNSKYNVKEVKVFPNPFRDKTQIIIEAEQLKNPVLLLMNIEGKIIKTISSNNSNIFDIYREDLTNGLYLFKIMQDKEEIANGKVVLQ